MNRHGLKPRRVPCPEDSSEFTPPSSVSLIGMRGSGKSTIGPLLATLTGKEFVDMDDILQRRFGTVEEIKNKHGMGWFRARESELAWELGREDDLVIGTGGGVVLNAQNIAALKRKGRVIRLMASIPVLAERIGEPGPQRPLLTGAATMEEDLRNLARQRRLLYWMAADFEISTEIEQCGVAEAIAGSLTRPIECPDYFNIFPANRDLV